MAQSRFARCHVLLHQTDDAPAYDLYVQRSFARYLWSWLEDAATEFVRRYRGLTVPSPRARWLGGALTTAESVKQAAADAGTG